MGFTENANQLNNAEQVEVKPKKLLVNWSDLLKSTSHLQLERELSTLKTFLDNYEKNYSSEPNNLQIAKGAKGTAKKAEDKLSACKVQEAWALFYKAELEQYMLLGSDELEGRAGKILFENTGMLGDAGKKRVRKLIGEDTGNGDWKLKNKVKPESVVESRRVIQEFYIEKYTN